MMIDITNELLTIIKNEFPNCTVLSEYQSTTPSFPTITIEEVDNSTFDSSKDSSGFKHDNIAFHITIYTIGNDKKSSAKKIRNDIDKIMSGKYGFSRNKPTVIPNYLDNEIYRYRLSYDGIIDKNKTIYGR